MWNVSFTGFGNMVTSINSQLGGMLGAGIMLIVFFIGMSRSEGSRGLLYGSFFSFIVGIPMLMMGLISLTWLMLPLILLAVSSFFAWRGRNIYDV